MSNDSWTLLTRRGDEKRWKMLKLELEGAKIKVLNFKNMKNDSAKPSNFPHSHILIEWIFLPSGAAWRVLLFTMSVEWSRELFLICPRDHLILPQRKIENLLISHAGQRKYSRQTLVGEWTTNYFEASDICWYSDFSQRSPTLICTA